MFFLFHIISEIIQYLSFSVTTHLLDWLSSINQKISAGEDVEKMESFCTVDCRNANWCSHYIKQPLYKLKKKKNRTVLWPSNFTSGYILKETQNINLKEYMHWYVYCSVIYNSQDMEAPQVPIRKSDFQVVLHSISFASFEPGERRKGLPDHRPLGKELRPYCLETRGLQTFCPPPSHPTSTLALSVSQLIGD